MDKESFFADINWAYILKEILWVPFDQVMSANQRTQGKQRRKGFSLTALYARWDMFLCLDDLSNRCRCYGVDPFLCLIKFSLGVTLRIIRIHVGSASNLMMASFHLQMEKLFPMLSGIWSPCVHCNYNLYGSEPSSSPNLWYNNCTWNLVTKFIAVHTLYNCSGEFYGS